MSVTECGDFLNTLVDYCERVQCCSIFLKPRFDMANTVVVPHIIVIPGKMLYKIIYLNSYLVYS